MTADQSTVSAPPHVLVPIAYQPQACQIPGTHYFDFLYLEELVGFLTASPGSYKSFPPGVHGFIGRFSFLPIFTVLHTCLQYVVITFLMEHWHKYTARLKFFHPLSLLPSISPSPSSLLQNISLLPLLNL